jgi:dihydroorotase
MALAYKAELEALAPQVTFLMSLYLNPTLTPEEIVKAKAAGIRGKCPFYQLFSDNEDYCHHPIYDHYVFLQFAQTK